MLIMALTSALLLLLSGFASVLETSLTAVNRLKIKILAEDGNKKAIKIMKLIDKYDLSITSIVIFNNVVNIILPTMSLLFFIEVVKNESLAATLSTIVVSILVIICGEIIPKIYGRYHAQATVLALATPLKIVVGCMYPLSIVITKITDMIKKHLFPKREVNDDFDEEIITIVNEEHEHGNLGRNQKNLITKAIMFNDKTVENIMKPKNKVIMVSDLDTNISIYKVLIAERYSRVPIYHEDSNQIIGVLNEREFLSNFAQDKNFDKNLVISDPYYVPDSMKISTLLPQMQKDKQQLAIVVDEYGTVQGIISIEDIIEELVGEIWDEHDEVVKKVRRLRPNQYLVESDVLISNLVDIVDIKSEHDQTIAKYVIEHLEKLPEVGDKITFEHFEIIVQTIDDNSIEQLLINIYSTKLDN